MGAGGFLGQADHPRSWAPRINLWGDLGTPAFGVSPFSRTAVWLPLAPHPLAVRSGHASLPQPACRRRSAPRRLRRWRLLSRTRVRRRGVVSPPAEIRLGGVKQRPGGPMSSARLVVPVTILAALAVAPATASARICFSCSGYQHFTPSADTGGAGSAHSQTFAVGQNTGNAGSHQQQVFQSAGPCPVPEGPPPAGGGHGTRC